MDHVARASMLLRQNRFEAAEDELRAALASDPNDAFALALLASCRLERGAADEARETAYYAIHLAPDEPFAYHVLANIEGTTGHLDQARRVLREAVRIDPEDPDTHESIAGIENALHRPLEALSAAQRGLEIDAAHVPCLLEAAAAHATLGQHDKAETRLRAALELDPAHAATHDQLGWLYLRTGRHDEAREFFQAALHLRPGDPGARRGFVETERARSRLYKIALPWLLRADAWLGEDPIETRLMLAIALGLLVLIPYELPGTRWLSLPLLFLCGPPLVLFMFARPALNSRLRRDPVRWFSLEWSERTAAIALLPGLLWGLLMVVFGVLAGPRNPTFIAMLGSFAVIPPAAAIFARSDVDEGPVQPILIAASAIWILVVAGHLLAGWSSVPTLGMTNLFLAFGSGGAVARVTTRED